MNVRKIIENKLIVNKGIAKIIGVSGSHVVSDKLKGVRYNRITEKNEADIKEFFYHFLKYAECFDAIALLDVFKLIIDVNSDEKADIACDAIERYEEKYMKLGLLELFEKNGILADVSNCKHTIGCIIDGIKQCRECGHLL